MCVVHAHLSSAFSFRLDLWCTLAKLLISCAFTCTTWSSWNLLSRDRCCLLLSVWCNTACKTWSIGHRVTIARVSEIFYHLLIILIQVAFPNHDNWVNTSWAKIVTTWRKVDACWCTFMAVKCVENVPLSQVPYLDSRVIRRRQEISAIRMESYLVDWVLMRVIVLKKTLATNIPDLDRFVSTTARNAGTIWVEPNGINIAFMIVKALDKSLLGNVPEFYSAIIWSRTDKPCVRRELGWADPVCMSVNWELELSVADLEDFECLVIRSRQQEGAITRECDALNRSWVALNDLRVTLDCVGP